LSALIEQRIAAADLTAEPPFSQVEQPVEATDEAMVAILEASLLAAGIPEGSPPQLKNGLPFPFTEKERDRNHSLGHAS
jgi:hypothetical protein